MTELFTEEQTIERVVLLTRTRLTAFVETEAVIPLRGAQGLAFQRSDIARLELLCELAEVYEIEEHAVAVMITLIDQLHAARQDARMLVEAIRAQPDTVRAQIASALTQDRQDR